jgi:hypothetical protein
MLNWLRNLNWRAWTLSALFVVAVLALPCLPQQDPHSRYDDLQSYDARGADEHAHRVSASAIQQNGPHPSANSQQDVNREGCIPCEVWKGLKILFVGWLHDPNAFFGSWVAVFTGLLFLRTVIQEKNAKVTERAYLFGDFRDCFVGGKDEDLEFFFGFHNAGKHPHWRMKSTAQLLIPSRNAGRTTTRGAY